MKYKKKKNTNVTDCLIVLTMGIVLAVVQPRLD